MKILGIQPIYENSVSSESTFLMEIHAIYDNSRNLRVVQTQAILYLKSISERGGSDIERL